MSNFLRSSSSTERLSKICVVLECCGINVSEFTPKEFIGIVKMCLEAFLGNYFETLKIHTHFICAII